MKSQVRYVVMMIVLISWPAYAQSGDKTPDCVDIDKQTLAFGDATNVKVSPDIAAWILKSLNNKNAPRVLINGHQNPDVPLDITLADPNKNCISLSLNKNAITSVIWDTMRNRASGLAYNERNIVLSFIDNGGRAVTADKKPLRAYNVTVSLADKFELGLFFSVLGFILIVFFVMAYYSDILKHDLRRDGTKAYSLAKLQMAFWTILIATAVVFVWVVQGQVSALDTSAMALMGISAVTFLGSVSIGSATDADTQQKIQTEANEAADKLAAVAAQIKIAQGDELRALTLKQQSLHDVVNKLESRRNLTKGKLSTGKWRFFNDIFYDHNAVQLHRFQMFAWTLVIGAIFVTEVIDSLKMPEIGATLLGLMGISSGTYLGFKLPAVGGGKE